MFLLCVLIPMLFMGLSGKAPAGTAESFEERLPGVSRLPGFT